MSMNRPPAVNALFAGHSLPRTAKALDQIREHITRLEEVVKLAGVSMELVEDVDDEAHALCERMKTAHNVKRVAKTPCTGCAYNVNDEVLRANCVGCQGFLPDTPHYVPASPDAPRNWWNHKPQSAPAEGPCAPWRSDYDPAAVKRGPVILDDDGEA